MNIEIDTSKIEALVEGMSDRVQSLGRGYVLPTLIDWQKEDMHRRFPNAEFAGDIAVTLIWPRSRTYGERHKSQPRRRIRALSSMPRLRGTAQPTSHRPILRPELFDKLVARMGLMMEENLAWRSILAR